MTLRARLVLTLVLLAAGGLLVVGGITYASQRSYQLQVVDDQTEAARPALAHRLDDTTGIAERRPDGDRGGSFPGGSRGGRPDPEAANLPPGTYGERRDATGTRIGEPVSISFGGRADLPPPLLPRRLALGAVTTVGAAGDKGLHYRVRVTPTLGGAGTTVVAIPLRGADEALHSLLLVLAVVTLAVLVLLGGLAWLLVGAGLRPLQRMGQTAGAIAAGDLHRRVEEQDRRTEVGRLGAAVNGMLARLEQAFAEREASENRLRQFLSDASHELRTPLASIRGYAELHRMGALGDPADQASAMQRIEDEAARMGVLVEDLLVLARLDEVREPVRVDVDLADLVEDAVADARATAPERELTASAAPGLLVAGDPDQLRQVLANLVRNALVHTPAGSPVEVRAHPAGGRVLLEVRDHGPGLPPGDPARLFDRFWRAEGAGRQRGNAGAGLGLAIVGGIAAAHGGVASATDAPGGGAVFVVDLPAAEAGFDPVSTRRGRGETGS